MTTRDRCTMLLVQGMRHSDIAKALGVSRQRVSQICGKYTSGHFRLITPDECVYPYWRKYMNDNKITRTEMVRRMGHTPHSTTISNLSNWMRGNNFPCKATIDLILNATGLTYEQLFYREA